MTEKTEAKILTDRIEKFRREKQLSYYKLAIRSEVPITTIMNITRGFTQNPGVFTIFKICKGLDVSVREFFDCEDLEP